MSGDLLVEDWSAFDEAERAGTSWVGWVVASSWDGHRRLHQLVRQGRPEHRRHRRRLVHHHWRRIGQATRAEQVAQLAYNTGCRYPDVVDAYAGQVAAAGSVADLRTALAACKRTLRARRGNTHDAWNRLQARTRQLAGQLERLRTRPSGRIDADGNPIPLRRHHPTNPRRSRPRRFQRHTPGAEPGELDP